jgi:hypothetical protein
VSTGAITIDRTGNRFCKDNGATIDAGALVGSNQRATDSNEAIQGFYAKLDYIPQFERDLAKRGKFEEFKSAYARVAGRSQGEKARLLLAAEQVESRNTLTDQNILMVITSNSDNLGAFHC